MLEAGTLLGERYEIIEKVGAGGMSVVYKAQCHKLKRYVAIKVLREEFAGDDTFVSKFRVEAQAAASLSHPNIINVFDVGSDNDVHYIVMEFVEGETLQQYVRDKGPLTSKETLEIGIKIAKALKVAHANKIVHRDIKPQNIIISPNGDVKVTDFGIARAASTSTITSSANAIGSVHYFSPEQARGGFVDEKSDLYSLGITMYEMVTNRVPFQAESPVAVAIQHIKEDCPSPKLINERVTESLEAIIMKATLKKPERRYQTAIEIIDDMKKSLKEPHENFVRMQEEVPVDSPTINITGDDLVKIKEETSDFHDTFFEREPSEFQDIENKDNRGDKWVVMSAVATSLVIIGLLVFSAFRIMGNADENERTSTLVNNTVVMPDLKGEGFDAAREVLAGKGMEIKKSGEEYSDTYAIGAIVSQSIQEGKTVEKGVTVEVVLSLGEEKLKAPSALNMSMEEAKAMLVKEQFKVEVITANDDIAPVGSVIQQEPKVGEPIEHGDTVKLMVSSGPKDKKVIMPNLKKLTESQAREKLAGVGLAIGNVNNYYNNEVAEGLIFTQTVAAGSEVARNYTVDIGISKGKQPEAEVQPESEESSDTGEETTVVDTEPAENNTDTEDNTSSKGITYVLPVSLLGDLEEGYVVVGVKTDDDIQYIHQNQMKKSDFPYELRIEGSGTATVQVHINGKLVSEDPISFQ